MTHTRELLDLQDKARRAGRVANFFRDEAGHVDGVFYLDPHGPGKQRAGMILDPLGFAERERVKPFWYDMLPANEKRKAGDKAARAGLRLSSS